MKNTVEQQLRADYTLAKFKRQFKVELVNASANECEDDYCLTLNVTDKKTGVSDEYCYTAYWQKAEPYKGTFNRYHLDEYIVYIIHSKYEKVITKGIAKLKGLSASNDDLETI